jgi:hypothetical protein
MSDKNKKFTPPAGFVVAVHANILGIRSVAQQLDMFPETLAEAMERAGFQLVPDPMDLTADAAKVIKLQEQQQTNGIRLVQEVKFDESGSDTSTN